MTKFGAPSLKNWIVVLSVRTFASDNEDIEEGQMGRGRRVQKKSERQVQMEAEGWRMMRWRRPK